MDIQELLNKMTIKEKIGQLVQVTPSFFSEVDGTGIITGLMGDYEIEGEDIYEVGSVLGSYDREEIISIQKAYLEKNRLGIPLIFMADVIHGIHTIFPIPLALASSWNRQVAEEMAELSAKECQISGVHLTFSPMVDMMRDPRWGRVMEGTGEDSYLNSEFSKAFVRGYQGEKGELSENFQRIAACVKHFVGYGAVEAGREYNHVSIDDLELYQHYLPSFKAAIDQDVKMVMTSFNPIKGIPSTGNEYVLKKLLRKQLEFEGTVIADWGAIAQLVTHGVAENKAQASSMALKAGCDIDMMTNSYYDYLESEISSGNVSMELLDSAVLRVLSLKKDLGLFLDPYRGALEINDEFIMGKEIQKRALEISEESIVLLKNTDNILPVTKSKKIALIGPKAVTQDVLGAWSGYGDPLQAVSLATGLSKEYEQIEVIPISSVNHISEEEKKQAVQAAKNNEVVILALGESSEESGEAASKGSIELHRSQIELLQTIEKENNQIVTVLFNGRPLDLRKVEKYSKGMIEAWFLGTQAGHAITNILTGHKNPSGKLPMTFPYSTGQIPITYNHMNTGNPLIPERQNEKYISKYLDIPNDPLYPFGYGLSYTQFSLQSQLEIPERNDDIVATVKVNVTNTGEVSGAEVVQLYIRDLIGQVVRPVKELKGFEKVYLKPGEQKTIYFDISPEDLSYYNMELEWVLDDGWFDVFVGNSSQAPKIGGFKYEA
ncbi:glycoside hydrolase family 3 N-terminal domain-containing protein [Enterococcus sp. DIV1314a]|uniref:glycoside hydrolase family 3 N-terminal domain-containing protein n=1 Tax=Enterococcus sp. DIV1314a TaxID=2774660 RepID=UPI003F22193A